MACYPFYEELASHFDIFLIFFASGLFLINFIILPTQLEFSLIIKISKDHFDGQYKNYLE